MVEETIVEETIVEEYTEEPSLHGLLEQYYIMNSDKEFPFEDKTLSVIVTPISGPSSNLSLFDKIWKFFGFKTFFNAFRVDLLKFIFPNSYWKRVATEVVNVEAFLNTSDKNALLKGIYERLRKAYEETK